MSPDPRGDDDRVTARLRAWELIHAVQAGDTTAAAGISALHLVAEERAWPEVGRVCRFGRAVVAWLQRDDGLFAAVDELIDDCTEAGDLVMLALGLSMRAGLDVTVDDVRSDASPDEDLARAVVLLERGEGDLIETISAHTSCGIAFGNRWFWELSDEQYATALAIGEGAAPGTVDFVLAPIVFNRAEAQVAWASALRQLGDADAVTARRATWTSTVNAAEGVVPASWGAELGALGLLIAAIDGEDRATTAREYLIDPVNGARGEARTVGHLKLCVALSDANAGRDGAREEAEAAIAAIDRLADPHEYDLALHLAAELEAAAGHAAGLRSARRQLEERWASRQAALGAMRARLRAERQSAEHDTLIRHAHLDDMTGIGNRRALDRHLATLAQRGVGTIALAIADVDRFKGINDRFGHLVGDAALIELAATLQASIRPDDLVARLGGDEFALVLADTHLAVAVARLQSVMEQLDRFDWTSIESALELTVSFGVAAGALARHPELRQAADAALYEAKATGGHKIVARATD